jgi:aminopeptidase N
MQSNAYYPAKEEALFQIAEVPFEERAELLRLAMESENLMLRQAVARTVTSIPQVFAEEYKTLLYDESYITREVALNVLCRNFPERKTEFLDIAKEWVGFNDKNLRILWLTLAYTAEGYLTLEKDAMYNELLDYASPKYESSIRQNALANLLYIGKEDPVVLQILVNATSHHKWQFAKFGRDSIRKLVKKESYRVMFESLKPSLPAAEAKRLDGILQEK